MNLDNKLKLEEYVLKAVSLLDTKYKLPKNGLLTGGALSNAIWKLNGGEKAIINDIDIFQYHLTNETIADYHLRKRSAIKNTTKYISPDSSIAPEDYGNILYHEGDKFISFNKEEKDDIYNFITIDSNTNNYNMILKSFDINSCQIGYNLEENKILYTDEYLDFFINKKLKVVSIQSPPNTLCRLVKKNNELGGNCLNVKEEFNLLKYSYSVIRNRNRILLSKKLEEVYNDNVDLICKYFKAFEFKNHLSLHPIEWEVNTKTFLSHYDMDKWYENKNDKFSMFLKRKKRYVKKQDFLFFYRNIVNDVNRLKLWVELPHYHKSNEYLDGCDIKDSKILTKLIEDSKGIYNLIKNSSSNEFKNIDLTTPNTQIFENMSLKEQIFVKDYIEEKVEEDDKNSILLNFIKSPLKYDNLKDLDLVFTSLRIKYRRQIQERINLKNDVQNSRHFLDF